MMPTQKGANPQFAKRSTLLTLCTEKGMSRSEMLEFLAPMYGKTEAEKEQIAEQLLTELKRTPA